MTIGRPLANVQTYILDGELQPVPVGVPGELFIGGPGLARGYLNRPELTAEKFIASPRHLQLDGMNVPLSGVPGARLYRTGDVARYRADGNLEYLRRLDHQVKIRGFRIELGEIESHIRRHPAIQDVLAVAREDAPGEKRLVAYLVAKGEDVRGRRSEIRPTFDFRHLTSDLRSHLEQELPEFMMPSAFVLLKALPLSLNGKVDCAALPSPEISGQRSEVRGQACDLRPLVCDLPPLTSVLAEIWQKLLKVERVDIRDNFFEIGGHLLLAVQVVSRIRSVLQVELPLRVFFEGPTVLQLAEYVETVLGRRTGRGPDKQRQRGDLNDYCR